MMTKGAAEPGDQPRIGVPDEPPAITPLIAIALLRLMQTVHARRLAAVEPGAPDGDAKAAGERERKAA